MIPARRIRPVAPAADKPTPDMEEIDVRDLTLVFMGGHVLPITLFPDDEFCCPPDAPRMSVKRASGEVVIIHKTHLLYETSVSRKFKQPKKVATPTV